MIRPEISKDLPCRSVLLKTPVNGTQYYCLLIYEKVSDDLPRQVVILEIDFIDGKPEGAAVGEEHVFGDDQWAELTATPDLWFGKWLSWNYRKLYGRPAPSGEVSA